MIRFSRSSSVSLFGLGLVVGLGVAVGLTAAEQAKAPAAKAPAGKAPVRRELKMVPAADLKWVDQPGANGVQTAVLWGDPAKGANGAFNKFPAGLEVPLHTHTHDVRAVVVSGTMVESAEGGMGTELVPGSYFFIPGGLRHTTACKAGSDCIVFRQLPGPFDLKPVEAAKK